MKKLLFILNILLFSIVFAMPVEASRTVLHDNDVLLCKYENDYKTIILTMPENQASFGYSFIFSEGSLAKDNYTLDAGDNFYKMRSNSVFTTGGNELVEENFTCPQYAYENITFGHEVCISDSQDSCGNTSKFPSEPLSLVYDFEDGLKELASDYVVNSDYYNNLENTIKDYIYGQINTDTDVTSITDDLISREVERADNILDFYRLGSTTGGNNLTPFVLNNQYYLSLYSETSGISAVVKSIVSEISRDAQSDSSLSEEDREKINEIASGVEENIDTAIYNKLLTIKNIGITSAPDCETLLGSVDEPDDPAYWLQMILDIMKYLAVAAVVVLSILDFIRAISSQDSDNVNKAIKTVIKRIIFAVLIFLFPIVLRYMFILLGVYSDPADPFCGLG